MPLTQELVVVGRDVEGPGLRVDDGELSRAHFRIAYDGRASTHRLGDAGSLNGTFIQGKRVQSVMLSPNDVVRAGKSVFVYRATQPARELEVRTERAAPTKLSVLILGETGTGKERVARALHEKSVRSGPFVAVNCAALPRELLAAELFGHTRGAFSGATQSRRGLFQAAHGGSLFLDEIGDFPMDLQAILLRALEEGSVRPIGSDEAIAIDVRVISATHTELDNAVREQRFRADLYARLAQAVLRMPALRDRRSEVLLLADELAREAGGARFQASADVAEALARWDWPFNVRELRSLVVGHLNLGNSEELDWTYLRQHSAQITRGFRVSTGSERQQPRVSASSGKDREALETLLRRHKGNVSTVAVELGKPRAQVYRWLRAAGLVAERYR